MKRALTLAGGGAKGAYEIGAYRALEELGYRFDIITGTSIGAVNGAMLVQGDITLAEELWASLTMDKVMDSNGLRFTDSENIDYYLEHREVLLPLIKEYMTQKGMDITPFKNMLNQYLNEERFFKSSVDFGLMTARFPTLSPVEITKSEISPGYLAKWVLASASCFPAFPLCQIDNLYYIDGMYYDNVPIDTAFRLGAEQVIAVTLKAGVSRNKYTDHPLVTYIEPSRPLGMALSFDKESIAQSLRLGYNDTKKVMGSYYGNAYTFQSGEEKQYETLARRVTQRIARLEAFSTPEQQRLAKIKGTLTPLEDCLHNMQIPSRRGDSTLLACIAESYMNLFDYPADTLYEMTQVLRDLVERSKQGQPEPTITLVLQAKKELERGIAIDDLLKQFRPETIITSLLLQEVAG